MFHYYYYVFEIVIMLLGMLHTVRFLQLVFMEIFAQWFCLLVYLLSN